MRRAKKRRKENWKGRSGKIRSDKRRKGDNGVG